MSHMPPKQIGIVAALPAELTPLVHTHAWKHEHDLYTGTLPSNAGSLVHIYATAAGIGSAAATRAFSRVFEASGKNLSAILSYGWAGAITCGIHPPDVYPLAEVIEARTGERFRTSSPARHDGAPLSLITIDHVARADEKRPLAERYHAVLVDMEAATIARLALAHGIDFHCIKGISDAYTDVLPDFNRFMDQDGQLRIPSLMSHAILRPRFWPTLLRLGINSKAAANGLAAYLPVYLEQAGLLS